MNTVKRYLNTYKSKPAPLRPLHLPLICAILVCKGGNNMAKNSLDILRTIFSTDLFVIGGTPITLLSLVRVAFIIAVAWWVSRLTRRGLLRVAHYKTGVKPSSLYALGRVLHYVIVLMGLFIGLSTLGFSFRNFAIVAGALGVGIGFGLQSMVNNFVAGLILLFEKSLKVDDFVELESGVVGRVREINFRCTRITTNDNIDILVPNSEFVNGRLTNWTLDEEYRRIHVPFGVAYGMNKEQVRKAGLEAAAAVPHTLSGVPQREAQVWFVGFGDNSLNFELVVWLTPPAVKLPAAVVADYLWEIHSALEKYAIEVPFPQRDIHLKSFFGAKGGQARAFFTQGGERPAKEMSGDEH
jgi:potassium efflux system protein